MTSAHINPNDWAGLNAPGTRNPSGIPGIQVDGYFPDTSTSNVNNGWNLLTYLPPALRDYSKYKAGDEAAPQRMLRVGFAPGSEFTWEYHYGVHWDLTQRLYREEFDPSYDRALDALLPIATDSDVYHRIIQRQDRGRLHRYYRIVGGIHVDGLNGTYGDRVRPILPCARNACTQLTNWVERDRRPPRSRTVPRPAASSHHQHLRVAVVRSPPPADDRAPTSQSGPSVELVVISRRG